MEVVVAGGRDSETEGWERWEGRSVARVSDCRARRKEWRREEEVRRKWG